MSEHNYKFNVAMSCGGCSGAIERVLKKLDGMWLNPSHRDSFLTLLTGVKSFNVSLANQTAEITTEDSLAYETVLEKIKKTGKEIKSGEADGAPRDV
jgi:copper chaperone